MFSIECVLYRMCSLEFILGGGWVFLFGVWVCVGANYYHLMYHLNVCARTCIIWLVLSTHAHIYTRMNTHTHTHTHTYIRTHTHIHTHAHTLTHTHTHTHYTHRSSSSARSTARSRSRTSWLPGHTLDSKRTHSTVSEHILQQENTFYSNRTHLIVREHIL